MIAQARVGLFCVLWLAVLAQAQDLSSVLRSYSGTPEQNAFLWRNLSALRSQPHVPPNVLQGLNQYRVAAVRSAREAVVREMMANGQLGDKALAGFINTGTWNEPKRFLLKSDVDFTAVGRDAKAVREFQQRFYQKLGERVGVRPGEVIKKLDVNCYSLGGSEPGAFRTPGGRRFFEVYSAKTGGYESITGSGANATVTRSHIDNAFIDLGKKVPRFTPGDSAMFAGELRSQMRANASAFRGAASAEAKANAKLVERMAYANAVAEGKVVGQAAAAQVVREAQALRSGQSLEQALAGRVEQLMKTGMSRQQAFQSATKQFVNETRNYVEHSTANLANSAAKAEAAQLAKTEGMLQKLSAGKLAAGAFKVGMGALTLYMLNDAYQRGGGPALAKEVVKQGLYYSFPPGALAELAGMGVKAGGQAIIDYANQCKADGVLKTMTGGTVEGMLDFYKQYHNPEKFREYLNREWEEQYKHGGAYWGKGLSDEEMKELVFEQGRMMMLQVTTLLREERQKEARLLRELQEQARKEKAEEEAGNEDRELMADLREFQEEERAAFRARERARAKAAKDKAESENAKKDDDERDEEKQAAAGVAPNLVRTNWSGTIAIQQADDEFVGGRVSLSIQFAIDNYNRISGTCRFPAASGQGAGDDTIREVPLTGRYDSRSGRLEMEATAASNSKPVTEMAGVPIVEESRLRAKLTGAADSGTLLTGDLKATITVTAKAGRVYSDDELQAWAAKFWRSASSGKVISEAEMAKTVQMARQELQPRELYAEPIEATWRVEKGR